MKIALPDTHFGQVKPFSSNEEFLKNLKSDYRHFINKRVFKFEDCFNVEIVDCLSNEQASACNRLYRNVNEKKINRIQLWKIVFAGAGWTQFAMLK